MSELEETTAEIDNNKLVTERTESLTVTEVSIVVEEGDSDNKANTGLTRTTTTTTTGGANNKQGHGEAEATAAAGEKGVELDVEEEEGQSQRERSQSRASITSTTSTTSSAVVDEVELILEETTSLLLSEFNQPKLIRVENLSESLEEIPDDLIWKSEDNINFGKKERASEDNKEEHSLMPHNLYRVKNISRNLNIDQEEEEPGKTMTSTSTTTTKTKGSTSKTYKYHLTTSTYGGGSGGSGSGKSTSDKYKKKLGKLIQYNTKPNKPGGLGPSSSSTSYGQHHHTSSNYSKLSLPNLTCNPYYKEGKYEEYNNSSSSSSTIDLIDDSEICLRSTIDLLLNDHTNSLADIYPYEKRTRRLAPEYRKKIRFSSQWNLSSAGNNKLQSLEFSAAGGACGSYSAGRHYEQLQPFLVKKICDLRTVRFLKVILPNHSIEIVELVNLNEIEQLLDVRFKNEMFRISFNKIVFAWK